MLFLNIGVSFPGHTISEATGPAEFYLRPALAIIWAMYLGMEIGGTKLQLAVGRGDGVLVGSWRGSVDVEAGGEGIRQRIASAAAELFEQLNLDRSRIVAVGVGFGGPVDDATSTVIKSHQISGWDNFPLRDWLADKFSCPAVLGNDADVAGLAEALFGAGRGLSPVFYITIGSGIGGGLIMNGRIHRGAGRGAAEIGHLRIALPSESGLRSEIVEDLASGWAIERAMRKLTGDSISAADVARMALDGDEAARHVLDRAWQSLAEAICHVITLICPRRIIIGGGVSLMGDDLLFQPLRRFVAERVFTPFADCYQIVPAALGEEVVIQGALTLARQHFPE